MKRDNQQVNRRKFMQLTGLGVGSGLLGLHQVGCSDRTKSKVPVIQGFDETGDQSDPSAGWEPISDRKVRVGLVGYGVCKFSAAFSFQDHPNVEVVAVSDLIPERCASLAKITRCNKTYPSLEELVKDDNIEAVFVATDAPSHARHCIEVLRHGKHVACAVPAVFGSLEEAEELFSVVQETGLKYMMFETSIFRENLYAMRQIYKAGGFGQLSYAEGEYWHYSRNGIDSFNNWRHGMPPQWYPTHSDAYFIGVTDGHFTQVSCLGIPSAFERYQVGNNRYKNPFSTEIALYQTSEKGVARMARSGDTIGKGYGSETGRVKGTLGAYYNNYEGSMKIEDLPSLKRPPLPPGVEPGGHGGSHGHLTEEFINAILEDRQPLIDIVMALNMTVGGVVAHQSAMRDGELLKIPNFSR